MEKNPSMIEDELYRVLEDSGLFKKLGYVVRENALKQLVEVKIAKEKELGRELASDEEIVLFENEMKKLRGNPDPQKIVGEDELEAYLAEGWEFVSVLPSRKILIRTEGAVPIKTPPS